MAKPDPKPVTARPPIDGHHFVTDVEQAYLTPEGDVAFTTRKEEACGCFQTACHRGAE